MLKSLRSRLWLSYSLLVLFVTFTLTGGVLVALAQNPVLFWQSILKIRQTETQIINTSGDEITWPEDQENLLDLSIANDLRIVILDAQGNPIYDTGAAIYPSVNLQDRVLTSTISMMNIFRDANRTFWVYSARLVGNGQYLVIMDTRPRLSFLLYVRNELTLPIAYAVGTSFVLALFISIFMTNWVNSPLRKIIHASNKLAEGKHQIIPEEGPAEVRMLASAFNDMSRKVEASSRSQRDFLTNVSHDLKTPLTSIQGFAQAILDGTADSPEALKQSAQVIYDEAGYMNRLVMDLLSLARLEGGTAIFNMTPINLNTLLMAVVNRFSSPVETPRAALKLDVPVFPIINGDSDRLAQVFNNIVENAFKFTSTQGSIII
ncbi:MAG TPA: HAMP domain-containing sensor histidine kinase, partial [Longilinea sp.]|nr:HAMP domain-containing sensor histidine kinase [Longilinea sp.]